MRYLIYCILLYAERSPGSCRFYQIFPERKYGRQPIIPISRSKSLKEQAYDKLKELIITGALEPGKLQNENRLAEALGVSRTPVREALLELSREGMVDFV
jgi:hypothetical protein